MSRDVIKLGVIVIFTLLVKFTVCVASPRISSAGRSSSWMCWTLLKSWWTCELRRAIVLRR